MGAQAPKNSRFKGVISQESLIGWFGYTARDESKENEQELGKREDGFFGYTASHAKDPTFTNAGFLKSDKDREKYRKQISKAFSKKGNLFWDAVISLESFEEADDCGLNSGEDWNIVVNKAINKFFKNVGLDSKNMLWWGDYHINTNNPHIHLTFLEKKQTRTKGKFSPKQLASFKRFMYAEINARKKLEKRVKTNSVLFFKDKDIKFNEIIRDVDQFLKDNPKITISKLNKILPKKGRLQYNSKNMIPYHPIIDAIIDEVILNNPKVNKSVTSWMKSIEILNETMNDIGSSNIATIKQAEMKKLYEQIGNKILQEYKSVKYNDYIKIIGGEKTLVKYKRKLFTKTRLEQSIISYADLQDQKIKEALEEFLRDNNLKL